MAAGVLQRPPGCHASTSSRVSDVCGCMPWSGRASGAEPRARSPPRHSMAGVRAAQRQGRPPAPRRRPAATARPCARSGGARWSRSSSARCRPRCRSWPPAWSGTMVRRCAPARLAGPSAALHEDRAVRVRLPSGGPSAHRLRPRTGSDARGSRMPVFCKPQAPHGAALDLALGEVSYDVDRACGATLRAVGRPRCAALAARMPGALGAGCGGMRPRKQGVGASGPTRARLRKPPGPCAAARAPRPGRGCARSGPRPRAGAGGVWRLAARGGRQPAAGRRRARRAPAHVRGARRAAGARAAPRAPARPLPAPATASPG